MYLLEVLEHRVACKCYLISVSSTLLLSTMQTLERVRLAKLKASHCDVRVDWLLDKSLFYGLSPVEGKAQGS